MLTDSEIKKLDKLYLDMRVYARGGAGGLRRSRALGSSVEFSDFREYAPGDDIRRVDWNAFARFERLYLKLFMEEQETALYLMLDASASMEGEKWAMASRLAEACAYLALRGGDRAQVFAFSGGGIFESGLLSGRNALGEISAFLESIAPGGETRLGGAIKRLAIRGPRGLCLLISDLFSADDWQTGIDSLLFRKNGAAVAHVLSPGELAPDIEGAIKLIDSETGEEIDLIANQDARRAYARALDDFTASAKSFCAKRGVAYSLVQSDSGLFAAIMNTSLVTA